MIDNEFKKAIKIIHKRLERNKIKWALVGSTNLQLQGMEVQPHDLDIVIQLKDLEKIRRIFSDYDASAVNEMKTLTDVPACEVKAKINDIEVQFIGGKDADTYVSKLLAGRLISINMDNVEIPCFTLEAESQAYIETNREHKAHLIRDFLKRT